MRLLITIFWYVDLLFFILCTLWVAYVALFALASRLKGNLMVKDAETQRKFAVLFPAYKEDNVIRESVLRFKEQDYPAECYDIVVISDEM